MDIIVEPTVLSVQTVNGLLVFGETHVRALDALECVQIVTAELGLDTLVQLWAKQQVVTM